MTDTKEGAKREVDQDIEELAGRLVRLSLTPATPPSLVVSEPSTDIELNLRSGRRMAFRVGRGRGRGGRGQRVANAELMETVEELRARVDAVTSDRIIDDRDVSEPEIEATEEEEVVQVTPEMRFFQLVLKSTARPWNQLVPIYQGGLNPEELIDWINSMEKFFDYEETKDDKKVKFVVTKLKGHAALWWDGVQGERKRLGKQPIKNWSRMVAKLRGKFLPSNYQQTLFRQMQNLRQRALIVKEYTEEFYKVIIRAGEAQDTDEKVARYMNGFGMDIQDEISLLSPKTVEKAYQIVLKAEEKLMRK